MSTLEKFGKRIDLAETGDRPRIGSLREFLLTEARVKLSGGAYGPYSFDGREAIEEIVATIDLILGSHTGQALKDSQLDICGGAQWGKTILALNLGAYTTACIFRNWGYYLPDDDLVEGIVDQKFRPDVIDQIEWLAKSIQVGKTLNKSGKAVNRKGAFLITEGDRKASGMIRGMGKIPTSFSMDVVCEDEKDDIDPKKAKFLKGRMTASDLRFKISIGTQRIHGAGQNKQFEEGSQHVVLLTNRNTGRKINPEENWPKICRMAIDGTPRLDDPCLQYEGDFRREGDRNNSWAHDPTAVYYLADPEDGTPLDRKKIEWFARRPERIKLRKWSFRVSQLGIAAIDLAQIVNAWGDAVKDSDSMTVFCCDVLAMPKSAAQALSPKILDRARNLEEFEMSLSIKAGCKGFGGVDFGDRCWFFAREVESKTIKRVRRVEQIASGDIVRRVVSLFSTMGLSALFVDARPLINEARTLCHVINGVADIVWPSIPDPESAYIALPGGLTWDGPNSRWQNLRCAVVEFTMKPGQGIRQKLGIHQEEGQTKLYPIIQTCRFDTIERVVKEFLTAEENVLQVIDGKLRQEPIMRLPKKNAGSAAIIETLDSHLLVGSKREKGKDDILGDYIDKVENHLLLADAYSGLAEEVCASAKGFSGAITSVEGIAMGSNGTRSSFTPRTL